MEALKNAAVRVIGSKQVQRALKLGSLARVYVAEDIDTFLYQKVTRAAEAAGVPVHAVKSSLELGRACGLEIASAAAGLPKEARN